MNFKLISRILALVISLVGILFLVTVLSADEKEGGLIEPFIYLSYITVGVSVALVVIYTIINLASKQGKDLKRTFISFGAFLLILILSYVFAEGGAVILKDGGEVSDTASKLVSAGINAFYILGAVAIFLMFFSSFNRIKK